MKFLSCFGKPLFSCSHLRGIAVTPEVCTTQPTHPPIALNPMFQKHKLGNQPTPPTAGGRQAAPPREWGV